MTVDLTGIATAVIGGVFSLLGIWLMFVIQSKVKNPQMAQQLQNATTNALGAIQKASEAEIQRSAALHPTVPRNLAPGVEYLTTHAAEAIGYFGNIADSALAAKLDAKIGLAKIAAGDAPKALSSPVIPPAAAMTTAPGTGTVTTVTTSTPAAS